MMKGFCLFLTLLVSIVAFGNATENHVRGTHRTKKEINSERMAERLQKKMDVDENRGQGKHRVKKEKVPERMTERLRKETDAKEKLIDMDAQTKEEMRTLKREQRKAERLQKKKRLYIMSETARENFLQPPGNHEQETQERIETKHFRMIDARFQRKLYGKTYLKRSEVMESKPKAEVTVVESSYLRRMKV